MKETKTFLAAAVSVLSLASISAASASNHVSNKMENKRFFLNDNFVDQKPTINKLLN